MSDRELLEKAAKAAGIVFDRSPYNGGPKSNPGFTLDGNPVLDWHNFVIWNPLTDDGDALRLAAKLYLWEAIRMAHRLVTSERDIYAATRLAIVRAAAALAGEANNG